MLGPMLGFAGVGEQHGVSGAGVMEIAELLVPRGVIAHLRVSNKKAALQEIARRGASLTGIAERRIYDVLGERERLGSTGIGRGIAIPHGKLPELASLYGLFARLERPIAFDAIDDQPVDLVFALLAPAASGAEHLRALARVSRLLRDSAICQKLRGTDSADALYALLTDRTESHAA
jgi:PTS system nitrogen regulatory IIA component